MCAEPEAVFSELAVGKQINQKDLKQALFVLHEQTAIALCLNLIVKNEQF